MSIEGVEHHATVDRAPLRNARSTGGVPDVRSVQHRRRRCRRFLDIGLELTTP